MCARGHEQAAFGEFYRIEQLILSTTQPGSSATGQAPIVSDANIRLLFAMQAEVDGLQVPYRTPEGVPANATLSSVCYNPLGEACAVQSVLQVGHVWRTVHFLLLYLQGTAVPLLLFEAPSCLPPNLLCAQHLVWLIDTLVSRPRCCTLRCDSCWSYAHVSAFQSATLCWWIVMNCRCGTFQP